MRACCRPASNELKWYNAIVLKKEEEGDSVHETGKGESTTVNQRGSVKDDPLRRCYI